MKRNQVVCTIAIILAVSVLRVSAQQSKPDEEISLDLLQGPLSPAANMLGISNSQIEKPTDAAAFMTSVQTASGNFTALPSSYAVDIAPAWLFAGNKITIQDYLSDSLKHNIPQSFVFSIATTTVAGDPDTMPDDTRLSAGIKLSICRGRVSQETYSDLSNLENLLDTLQRIVFLQRDSLLKINAEYTELEKLWDSVATSSAIKPEIRIAMTEAIGVRMAQISDSVLNALRIPLNDKFETVRTTAESVRFLRYGFKLDLSAGVVWDFPDLNMAQGQMTNAAVWLTGGYESPGGVSCLGIARYLYFHQAPFVSTPDEISYLNNNAFDLGARLIYSNPASRFSASAEGIYRYMFPNDLITPESTWRLTANLEYEVGRNKKLTLVVGRDFSGTLTTDGTLIAALNFLIGFGTNKKL